MSWVHQCELLNHFSELFPSFLLHEYIQPLKCMNYHSEELRLISSCTIPGVKAIFKGMLFSYTKSLPFFPQICYVV